MTFLSGQDDFCQTANQPISVRHSLRAISVSSKNCRKRIEKESACVICLSHIIKHKSRLSRYLTYFIYFSGRFLEESFDFKQFKSGFFGIFSSNYLLKVNNLDLLYGF